MIEVITEKDVQEYIKSFEALKYRAYKCPAGVWTIGYGSTHPEGKPVKPGMTCTYSEAVLWFLQEIKNCEESIARMVKREITKHQVSSFVDIAYNIGTGGLGNSLIIRHFNNGNLQGAADSILKHNKARVKGVLVELPGLTKRRKYDYRIFWEKDIEALKPLPEEIPTIEELAEIQGAGLEKIELKSWDDIIQDFNNTLPEVPV